MSITALPTPPSRSDPANFATRADAFHTALPTFATEANVLQADVNAKQVLATAAAATAQAALDAGLANAAANAATAQASAASAVSVVQQDLSVIDRTVFASTALVDVCLYDTSKDSDGGAWRKRCSHTSWENETLSGNWLGSAANEAAARALSGAVTGSYYYDTTAAVFRKLNAGSGVTEVFRGNARQFPAQVLITAEASRVVLWDVTQAGCPMWMASTTAGCLGLGTAPTSVAGMNGTVMVAASNGLFWLRLVTDSIRFQQAGNDRSQNLIASRQASAMTATVSPTYIASNTCNDVAMTVLPSAPIDGATGLPVPTIAVATNGGVSVIKDDGNVWDITSSAGGTYSYATKVEFFKNDLRFSMFATGQARTLNYSSIPTADKTVNSSDAAATDKVIIGTVGTATLPRGLGLYPVGKLCVTEIGAAGGGPDGVTRLCENPTTPANGMVAYITKDYNSGWMPGDIRGAWLADTVAETLTGAELVTNGAFPTNSSGWSAVGGATLSVGSGELTVTNVGAVAGGSVQAITTVAGKAYTASCTARKGLCSSVYLFAGTTSGGTQLGVIATNSGTNVTLNLQFVATGTITYLAVGNDATNNGTGIFDNVVCRAGDVDRCVKAKGLQAFGSLTKAVVASGAQLMGYSGFSAANYLEQPYNSDLDFGTGDFCVIGWMKVTTSGDIETVFSRAYYSGSFSGSLVQLYLKADSTLCGSISDDGNSTTDLITSSQVVDDSVWRMVTFLRRSTLLELWIDATKAAADTAITNASGSLSNASATLRMGLNQSASSTLTHGNLALWRTAAYAPSADQIKHIYETEKALFEANAQCLLAGSSNAVTALAYDDETDLLHVGTSYGRSAFKGLVRTTSEATPVGSIVALAAGTGIVSQVGASGADVYVPAYSLREELQRDAEQMARFGQNLIAHDYSATSSQTTFTLPIGWEIVAVYAQGAIKQEGSTKDWTRTFDGFRWSVVFASGRSTSDWISILAKRT